jgi:hypothetical protein
MTDFVKTVSHAIETQFPNLYREEGREMVEFVKAYYEFLETDKESYLNRGKSASESFDVDKTLDEFIVKFKKQYLADFPFVAATDKRFMIKHIQDYYKSKGTIQGLKLLMQLLYGDEVDVYYPSSDILKPSASEWHKPEYIEVTRSPKIKSYLDQQITGTISLAKAFVDGIVTKRINGKIIDVLYLSDVKGVFKRGENVVLPDGEIADSPTIIGSLSDVQITLGGRDNKIGDIFDVVSDSGTQGQIRVTKTIDATGQVDFEIVGGGSGYTKTDTTDIYISDSVVFLDNPNKDFIKYERVEQPLETLSVLSGTDVLSNVVYGTVLEGYNSSNTVIATGKVISSANTDANGVSISIPSANGNIKVLLTSGSFRLQERLALSGPIGVSVGDIVEEEDLVTLNVSNVTGTYSVGETVKQTVTKTISNTDFTTSYSYGVIDSINGAILVLSECFGDFVTNESLVGANGATSTVSNVTVDQVGARAKVSSVVDANTIIVDEIFGIFDVNGVVRGGKSRLQATLLSATNDGAVDVRIGANTSANAVIDIVSDKTISGIVIGQNTSAIGVYGNSERFYSGDGTFIKTVRDELWNPPKFEKFEPTYGFPNPDLTYSANASIDDLSLYSGPDVAKIFKFDVKLPDFNIGDPTGSLMSMGGQTNALWAGIRSDGVGGYLFRVRAGYGAAVTANTALIDVPVSQLPLSGDMAAHIVFGTAGDMKLYINGLLQASASGYVKAFGNVPGNYGNPNVIPAGEPNRPWAGKILSPLQIWWRPENADAIPGNIKELKQKEINSVSTGNSADFKIGDIANEEVVTLNTDLIGANNFANIPFVNVGLDGSGSGVGFVDSVTIYNGGTMYSNGTIVTFSGGGYANGNPLVAAEGNITTDANGSITSITVTNPGEGYFEMPVMDIGTTSGITANVEPVMDYGYGFERSPNGDSSTIIADLLTNDNFTIGEISRLTSINPGTGYNADPFITVRNKYIASHKRGNYIIKISSLSGSFVPGELIVQGAVIADETYIEDMAGVAIEDMSGTKILTMDSTEGSVIEDMAGAPILDMAGDQIQLMSSSITRTYGKGKVISANTTHVIIERTNFQTAFVKGVHITGNLTGASANVDEVVAIEDYNIMGDNANIDGDVVSANGIAVEVEVIDSGFGYEDLGEVTLANPNTPFIITGNANVVNHGKGSGYWRSNISHLSSSKKIQDSDYYQEFSYDVLSGRSLNRYETVLRNVLHVAGTKLFGGIRKVTQVESKAQAKDSVITIT